MGRLTQARRATLLGQSRQHAGHGPNGDCWLWMASDRSDYEAFSLGGRMIPHTDSRFAWVVASRNRG